MVAAACGSVVVAVAGSTKTQAAVPTAVTP